MAKEEMAKLTPKEGVQEENVYEEKLTKKQVSVYIGQLEDRLKRASEMLKEMKKELELYQMQDYYQRAQLLCMIIANDKIEGEFRMACQQELIHLVYPPKEESKDGEQ